MKRIFGIASRFFLEQFHDRAALMAYYFMLAIFPFLIFVLSIISLFPIHSENVLEAIKPFAPASSYDLIQNNLQYMINTQRTGLVSISFIAAFWVASLAVQALVKAMNLAYRIVRKEGFFLAMFKDFILTAGLMFTLAVSLLVPIAEEIGRLYLVQHIDLPNAFYRGWTLFKWTFGTIYLFLFFLLLYKLVPSAKTSFSSALPGALFTTILWQITSVGFSYYVTLANYTLLYGQLGSLMVLMIWFYLTASVLLIGGLINAEIEARKTGKTE